MIDAGSTFLILSKWHDEETLLLCRWISEFSSVALTGVVSGISTDLCEIKSRKGEASFRLRLDDPGVRFEYAERRAVSEDDTPEDVAERGGLAVFFPRGGDTLTISELLSSEVLSG